MLEPERQRNLGQAVLLLVLFLAVACRREPEAGVWPQWRGPSGYGLASGRLPVEWSADSANIRWKSEIPGVGISQPIVSAGRIFLTTAFREGRSVERVLLAYDLDSGENIWRVTISAGEAERRHRQNGYSTPTPATDGASVFVYTGQRLTAVDRRGKLLWQEEIDPLYLKMSRYGAASSPIVIGDEVIVFRDRERGDTGEPSWLAAFEKKTGRKVWRSEWEDTCCSYAAPIKLERPWGAEIVIATSPYVAGFDPDTGERLWSHDHQMIQIVPTPVAENDVIAITGGIHDRKMVALRLGTRGEQTEPEVLWETTKGTPELASPVMVNGKLFVVTDGGIATCLLVEKGRRLWTERLPAGMYANSMLAAGDRIYVTNGSGVTSVIAATRKFELLAENHLGETVVSSPAVSEWGLILRGGGSLYRIDGSEENGPQASTPEAGG